jgi:hypothetical protein
LPLLDAVKERREAEALRKKREDDLAAERAKGIFSVSGPAVGGRG